MLVLPNRNRNRKSWLRAFWLLFSTGAAIVVWIFAVLLGTGFALSGVLAGAVVASLYIPGLLRPRLVSYAYLYWNRAARIVAALTRVWLTVLLVWVVFLVVGRTGSGMQMRAPGPGASGWKRLPARTVAEVQPRQWWGAAYLSWARESGNGWAMILLPVLLVLASVELYEERSVPTHTYTLY